MRFSLLLSCIDYYRFFSCVKWNEKGLFLPNRLCSIKFLHIRHFVAFPTYFRVKWNKSLYLSLTWSWRDIIIGNQCNLIFIRKFRWSKKNESRLLTESTMCSCDTQLLVSRTNYANLLITSRKCCCFWTTHTRCVTGCNTGVLSRACCNVIFFATFI